jgi:hypothetical protein
VQQALAGDTLVMAADTWVDLVQTFRPDCPNGLYKGIVRVQEPGHPAGGRLYALSGICNMRNQPGWPCYDNLYAHRIANVAEAERPASKSGGPVSHHCQGRSEASGGSKPPPGCSASRTNPAPRGDFDDRPAVVKSKG